MRTRSPVYGAALAAAALTATALSAQPADTVEEVGKTVAVTTEAAGTGIVGERILSARDAVYRDETIVTDETGVAQIRFLDDTKLAVGPNSSMTIDEFVYRSDNTVSRFAVNVTRGAFRFISGASDKEAYTVRTPLATIGMRGTEVEGVVDPETGQEAYTVFDGAAEICTFVQAVGRRVCAILEGRCTLVLLDPLREFEWVQNVYERTDYFDESFVFIFDEWRLELPFRVSSAGCQMVEYHIPLDPPDKGTPPPKPPTNGHTNGCGGEDVECDKT